MRTLTTRNVCRQLTLSDTAADYKNFKSWAAQHAGSHMTEREESDAPAEPLTCAGSEDQRYPP